MRSLCDYNKNLTHIVSYSHVYVICLHAVTGDVYQHKNQLIRGRITSSSLLLHEGEPGKRGDG